MEELAATIGLRPDDTPLEPSAFDPRRVAVHEAGHAVAAALTRVPFVSVEIAGAEGRVVLKPRRRVRHVRVATYAATMRAEREALIVVALSGLAAELIHFGASGSRDRDLQDALALAGELGGEAADHLTRLLARAQARLRAHIVDVENVAAHLLERRVLSASDVRRILAGEVGRPTR